MRTAFSVCAWGFLASLPFPAALHAATRTDSFGVTVMVQDTCVASLNRSTAQTDSTRGTLVNGASAVSVTCRNLTRYDVALSTESQLSPAGISAPAPAPPRSAPVSLPRDKTSGHRTFASTANESSQPPVGDTPSPAHDAAPGPDAHTITVTVIY
jgi:hypothetical protein